MARKMKSMDGNNAAAHVSYAFSEVAAIYPITPSSPMADLVDQWSANGLKNIFGSQVKVVEMQSEAGAAGAVHGSLGAGALTTTYTASQGLLLMIPNMYKIAAEQLPCVFHVSARTVSTHALNIFGDHSDVMACRQTGFAMLCEGNVQEVMDLSPVAHLAALSGKVPFINFFDGFRTSHEIQKIAVWDYKDLADMCDMDAVKAFREHALNPEHPAMRGSHENGDTFFQHREACNQYYDALPEVVEKYMGKINEKLGTDYKLFNYYGAPDADRVIIAMGSICDVAEEVIDYLNAHGEKVGLIKVRLYRPFKAERLIEAIPATAKKIAVLDRTKEPGAQGEPLYLDVVTALANAGITDKTVIGGRYGLGSKDTPPASVFAVYTELAKAEPKRQFTIGIVDDVTNLSLPEDKNCPNTAAEGTIECKFWGLGGDGTVGANKNSIKIIGDHTDKYVQAYFQYDSKKTGGVTISHLRFGDKPIRSPYYINKADFVACHNPSYITKGFKMVNDVKPGGVFMINCQWDFDELNHHLKADAKRYIAKNNIQLYTINAIDLAIKIGMGKRNNTILQSAFFSLAKVMPEEQAIQYMKDAATHSYLKKGQDVVDMNHKAIDLGATAYTKIDVPADWANAVDADEAVSYEGKAELVEQVKNILDPVDKMDGDSLPVSAFMPHVDGMGAWRCRLRKARRCRFRSHVGRDEVHSVQQLRLRLPARHHPSLRSHRGRGQECSCQCQDRRHQGRQGQGCLQVHDGHLPARLYGLRRLRRSVPGRRSDDGWPGERASRAGCVQLLRLQGLRQEGHAGSHRQGQPVQAAHARVLRLLRRLRRDQLCPSRHSALRRPYVHLQRHRLLVHLGRPRRYLSVLHG